MDNLPAGAIAVQVILIPSQLAGQPPTPMVNTDNTPTQALFALNIGMAILLGNVQDIPKGDDAPRVVAASAIRN